LSKLIHKGSSTQSKKQLSKLIEDVLGLRRFDLFQDNIAIFEQADTQRLLNTVQENVEVEAQTPIEGDEGAMNEI